MDADNGPWTVYQRERPLRMLLVTNGWHMPRALLIARHLRLSGREEVGAAAGGAGGVVAASSLRHFFHVEAASVFMNPLDSPPADNHLRDGRILASRVVLEQHGPHFEELRGLLGRELREVGSNMRRLARKWNVGVLDDTRRKLGRELVTLIKSKDRKEVTRYFAFA